MVEMIGADVAALRSLGRTLRTEGQRIGAARTQLTGELGRVGWHGRDAEAFRSAWRSSLSGLLADASRQLREAGEEVHHQADEQARASGQGSGLAGAGMTASLLTPGLGQLILPGRGGGGADFPASADDPNAPTSSNGYQIGPPRTPNIEWDEDYEYASQSSTVGDRWEYVKWRLKGEAAQLLMDDGAAMYLHYLNNSGEDVDYDLAEGYGEDTGIANSVNQQITQTAQGVDELVLSTGQTQFQVTGPASPSAQYPTTENWQKAIGAHQQWSSANVTVENGVVTMEITVHAEDRYNFNRGQSDISSGTPDDVNGRFTEVGLAQPFNSHGTMTQTISWPVGQPPATDAVDEQVNLR